MSIDVASFSEVVITATDRTKSAWESVRAEANKTANDITAFQQRVMGPFMAVQSVLVALAAAIPLIKFTNFINDVASATAALHGMSEVTGASAASLSAIAAVARLSSTDMGNIEAALVKMTKGMSGAEDQTKGFGSALTYLGLSARDSQGNLKSTDALFLEIANSLNLYADGAGKTAIAQALFGKAGASMIPVLKDLADVGEYNAEVTNMQAAAADEYEKNLKRLGVIKTAVTRQVAQEFIPALNDLAVMMLRAANESNGLRSQLGQLVKDGSIRTWADDAAMSLAKAGDMFLKLQAWMTQTAVVSLTIAEVMARGPTLTFANPLSERIAKQLAAMKLYLEDLKSKAGEAQGYYARILGQQQAGRREGENIDPTDLINQQLGLGGKPRLNFRESSPAKLVTEVLRDVMNQKIALEQAIAATQKALIESGYEIFKSGLERELADIKASYDLRLMSEREWIDADTALRVELATANRERLQEEIQGEIQSITASIALLAQIKGKDRADQERLQLEASTKIEAMRQKLIKLLGDEKKAEEAIAAARAAGADKALLYYQRLYDQIRSIGYATEDYIRGLGDQTAAEQLQFSLMSATAVQQRTAQAMAEYNIKLRDQELQYLRQIDSLNRSNADPMLLQAVTDQYVAQRDALTGRRDAQLQNIVLIDQERERVESLRLAWQAVDSAAFDMFKSIFDQGTDTWKKLRDSLKDTLIKYLYELTVQRWVMQLFVGVNGSSGGFATNAGQTLGLINSLFGGSSSVSSMTGLASLFSSSTASSSSQLFGLTSTNGVLNPVAVGSSGGSGAGFWSTSGGFGSVGTAGGVLGTAVIGAGVGSLTSSLISKDEDASMNGALAGAAGSVIGAWIATGTAIGGPWGAIIGAVIGGLLAAFSDMDGPAMRSAKFVSGQQVAGMTYQGESQFGTFGIERGSDKWFSDSEMGETLSAWMDTIKMVDNAIADRLSATQVSQVQGVLAGQSGTYGFGIEHTDMDAATLGTIMRDRYEAVFNVLDAGMGKLIGDFEGTTGDLLALIDDLATVFVRLQDSQEQIRLVFGQDLTFADIERLKGESETYSQTLTRLAATYEITNTVAIMFGKTQEEVWGAVGLASLEAREHLMKLAGGAQNLGAQLDFFYQNFFSETERHANSLKMVQDAFARLGIVMPATRDEFRDLVQGLDLSTESGRKMWEELMKLAPAFAALVPAIGSATDAVNEAKEATEAKIQIDKDLAQSLRNLGVVSLEVQSQMIRMAGGSQQLAGQLDFFFQNFFTDAQKQAQAQAQVNATFEALGIAVPRTTAEFAELVMGIDTSTASGQAMFNILMQVAPAFLTVGNAAEAAAQQASAAAAQLFSSFQSAVSQFRPAATAQDLLSGRNQSVQAFMAAASWTHGMSIDDVVNALTGITDSDFRNYSRDQQQLITQILDQQGAVVQFIQQQQSTGVAATLAVPPAAFQTFGDNMNSASDGLDQLAASIERARSQMAEWLKSLGLDANLSPLLPMQQFQQAQSAFVETILQFNRADPNSYSAFQQSGSAFLNQALNIFPRAGEIYGDIFSFVQNAGQTLLSGGQVTALLNQLIAEIQRGARANTQAVNQQTEALVEAGNQQARESGSWRDPNKLQ